LDTLRLDDWLVCERCALHATRRSVVLGRGDTPADILFIGLGPGKTENLLGEPFVGESGRLLQGIINGALELAMRDTGHKIARTPRYFITNIVACRPCDTKYGPNRDPREEEIWACMPRLNETVRVVKPTLTILFGKVAQRYYLKDIPCAYGMEHPRYLLSKGGKGSPMYPGYVRRMSEAITNTILKGGV
jgi:uracil-DNA glycosylase family 4